MLSESVIFARGTFFLHSPFELVDAEAELGDNRWTALPSNLSNFRNDTCCNSSSVYSAGCFLQRCLYAKFRACIRLLQYGHVTVVHMACFRASFLAVMVSKSVWHVGLYLQYIFDPMFSERAYDLLMHSYEFLNFYAIFSAFNL